MMRSSLAPALGALLALSLASAAPGSQGPAEGEDGQLALPGTWPCQGGSPARTRQTATTPASGRLVQAWSIELDGKLLGDPLVWSERIVLEVEESGRGRRLVALDRRSGEERAGEAFKKSSQALVPCLGGGHPDLDEPLVAARVERDVIAVFRLRGEAFEEAWRVDARGPVGPPLLFERELYFTAEGELRRYIIGHDAPLWSHPCGAFGSVSLRGEHVFVATSEDREIVARSVPRDGPGAGEGDALPLGTQAEASSGAGALPLLSVLDETLFARTASPLQGIGKTVAVARGDEERDTGWSLEIDAGPAGWRTGALAHCDSRSMGSLWFTTGVDEERPGEMRILVSSTIHPELLVDAQPPATAGDVGYVSGVSVDLETLELRHDLGDKARGRTIPVQDGVLVVTQGGRRLTAFLRDAGAKDEERGEPLVLSDATSLALGTVVCADGTVWTGALELGKRGDATLLGERRKRRFKRDEVDLVLDGESGLVRARSFEAWLAGIHSLARARASARAMQLAEEALDAEDFQGAVALHVEALVRGADVKALRKQAKKLQRAAPAGADASAGLGELEALTREVWLGFAPAVREHAAGAGELEYWRRVLALFPDDETAAARVEELLDASGAGGLELTESAPVRSFLPYLAAAAQHPLTVHPVPTEDSPEAESFVGSMLRLAADEWRTNVLGFASRSLLVIAAPSDPEAVAHAVRIGECVASCLDEVFDAARDPREDRLPLVVFLHASEDELIDHAEEDDVHFASRLGLPFAGHFDPGAIVSHLALPANDPYGPRALATAAHALTHHWLSVRHPRYSEDGTISNRPGAWIVEGFAGLVEEFTFDPLAGTWSDEPEWPRRLDVVASANARSRIDWSELLATTGREFARLDTGERGKNPSTHALGFGGGLSEAGRFACQATALCRALYDGADSLSEGRERLFAFLLAAYTGDSRVADAAELLGASPEELGRAAERHAADIVGR